MKKKENVLKVLIGIVALTLFFTIKVNKVCVNAADWSNKTTEITLFVGETWTWTMANETNYLATEDGGTIYGPNGYSTTVAKAAGNSKRIKDYAIATISKKTCSVRGVKAGSNDFYVYKKDGKPGKKIRVKVMDKPVISSITNQYYNAGTSKSNNIYLYVGESSTATITTTGTVQSRTWTVQSSSGGSTTGITVSNATSNTCTIKAVKVGTYKATVTVTSKSTMSTVTVAKTFFVYVYTKPELFVYNNGSVVTSKQLYINHPEKFSLQLKNLNSTDIASSMKCVSQDETKFKTSFSGGEFTITPLNKTNGVGVNAIFSVSLSSAVTKNNDSGGKRTFTKTVSISIKDDPVVYVKEIKFDKAEYELEIGTKKTINASVFPNNATYKSVIYSSSNSSVADVSSNGVVTAYSCGTATISATSTDGTKITTKCKITVREKTPGVPSINLKNLKSSIMISWKEVSGAESYEVYRSKSVNQGYSRIATSKNMSFSDTSVEYNKKYYYKVCAVSPSGYKSNYSAVKQIEHEILKPQVKSVKKIKDGFKISIKGTKYSGFAVYAGKSKKSMKLVTLVKSKNANIFFKMKKGKKYYVKVKAYTKVGKIIKRSKASDIKRIK